MRLSLLCGFLIAASSCASHVKPVFTSDAARIWVVQQPGSGDEQILRCADGAAAAEVPKPLCVKATLVSADAK